MDIRPHQNNARRTITHKKTTAKLDADPELQTSLRWLAKDTKNPLHKLVLKLTRATGVLAKDEVFDHRQGTFLFVWLYVCMYIYGRFLGGLGAWGTTD